MIRGFLSEIVGSPSHHGVQHCNRLIWMIWGDLPLTGTSIGCDFSAITSLHFFGWKQWLYGGLFFFFVAGFVGSWFYAFPFLSFSAFLLFRFSAFLLLCFLLSLLLCFSCFSAFLLLCFLLSLLLCFSCFSAFVLLCLSTSTIILFLFFSHVFCCSTSRSFASLLPVSLCFSFFFVLFCSVCILNETLERP